MRALSHSNILACFLLAVLLPSLSEAAEVRLQRIKIFQTHDLPFWKPSVYFQCEGEPKRQLDVVVEVNVDYNFTLHEPFQVYDHFISPFFNLRYASWRFAAAYGAHGTPL
ncbi:hypothetical protein CLOM_g10736 [Closterium sp. NIES-68]|nr:hypothetical protein CLOM_g10736 [Closterium sp. NIES-68]GJP65040.1 hypothetical protein CLOP_g21957 [Closterium sp. NIES-67]